MFTGCFIGPFEASNTDHGKPSAGVLDARFTFRRPGSVVFKGKQSLFPMVSLKSKWLLENNNSEKLCFLAVQLDNIYQLVINVKIFRRFQSNTVAKQIVVDSASPPCTFKE